MIALATVQREFSKVGSGIQIEITVEAVRHRVPATVAKTPFYNPKHKTRVPV
jgi:glycine cleavage system aminomethyltransferase T